MSVFREMRRFRQALTRAQAEDILERGSHGVLALLGDDGYPYAVPLSYVYSGGRILFHGAREGHKIDAMRFCDKASFCVVDEDRVVPEKYTTYFRSAIAFGKVRLLEGGEALRAAALLAEKYRPGHEEERVSEIERGKAALCAFALFVEHLSGKQAIELVRGEE